MPDTSLPWKTFQPTNAQYDSHSWARQRALYAGGDQLLRNDQVMSEVFPQHNAENDGIYQERKRRAFYLPYAGAVVDLIVAGLFAERPSFEADPKADPWYDEWLEDVSLPGGRTVSFCDLLKTQIRAALLHRRAWTLVELPEAGGMPQSLADEEALGTLDCYACPVEPECVRDWEMDEDGKLAWVLLAFRRCKRDGLTGTRDNTEEEFVYYTPTEFARYAITYDKKHPPKDDTPVPLVAAGTHTFGRVPLIPLELPEGLHAMGKLESICVAHLNTRNALTWAQYKSLFAVPHAFLDDEAITGSAQSEDPDRAVNQTRSVAHMVSLRKGDRVEFIGPPTDAFSYAASDCAVLRDEMYRVVHHMADSIDNSGAALQRSGDSKQADRASTTIILKFLGEEVSRHAVEILETVGKGRKDPEVLWTVHGMEEFEAVPDMDAALKEATAITTLDINSPTFQRAYKFKVAKQALGDEADAEMLEDIRKELEENNPAEFFAPPPEPAELPEGGPETQDMDEMMGAEGDAGPAEADGNQAPPKKPAGAKPPVPVVSHLRKPPKRGQAA
jgi:hypothetical protein